MDTRRGIGIGPGEDKAAGSNTSRHEMLSMLPRARASPINRRMTFTNTRKD